MFADPDKVHPLDYDGEWFKVRGRSPCPARPRAGRSCCRRLVGPGRDFAARWAELIFTGDPNVDVARSHYKDQKERIAARGRDPEAVKMLPMAYTVIGESRAHAEEREQLFLNDLVDPQASLTLLSELMNYDFSGLPSTPITDELVESVSGIRGLVQNLRQHIGGTVTLADLAGHRATLLQGPRFVGTAREVADQMEEWFEGDACDGFVIAATHVPGAYEDVVRMLVPELQRRGCSAPSTRAARCARTRSRATGRRRPWLRGRPPGERRARAHARRRCSGCVVAATLAAGPMVGRARRVRRRGDQGRAAGRRPHAHVGQPARRHRPVWKSVSRNKRCVTCDLRQPEGQEFHRLLDRQRRAGRGQPAERARALGHRLRVGARRHPPIVMCCTSPATGGAAPRATVPATARWPRP